MLSEEQAGQLYLALATILQVEISTLADMMFPDSFFCFLNEIQVAFLQNILNNSMTLHRLHDVSRNPNLEHLKKVWTFCSYSSETPFPTRSRSKFELNWVAVHSVFLKSGLLREHFFKIPFHSFD